MKLEQPKTNPTGRLPERMQAVESYLYRLHGQLQAALNALENERRKQNGKES